MKKIITLFPFMIFCCSSQISNEQVDRNLQQITIINKEGKIFTLSSPTQSKQAWFLSKEDSENLNLFIKTNESEFQTEEKFTFLEKLSSLLHNASKKAQDTHQQQKYRNLLGSVMRMLAQTPNI